jgi:DNA excision repair protein ERCC-4
VIRLLFLTLVDEIITPLHVTASGSSNTILVMTSSTRTCTLVTEFLSGMDENAPPGTRGRKMMMRKLKTYLWWKSQLASKKQNGRPPRNLPALITSNYSARDATSGDGGEGEVSAALRKKDQDRAQKAQSRRRVRGGAPASSASGTRAEPPVVPKPETREYTLREVQGEADGFVQL